MIDSRSGWNGATAPPEPPRLDRGTTKWYLSSMSATAKVFRNGRSQAIRLPKDFRVSSPEVRLTRVPGGILITEADPWDAFEDECGKLPDAVVAAMEKRGQIGPQSRDFSAGLR